MIDPIMMAVATTLAARAAGVATPGRPVAWAALVRLVRRRFAGNPDALASLEVALSRRNDPKAVQVLAGWLDRIAAQDPDFDAALRALWSQVADTARGEALNGHVYRGPTEPR